MNSMDSTAATVPVVAEQPDPIRRKPRIASIDLLRGIVMVLMALDHVRYFFHFDAALHSPTDLATTTPLLFFTRWITHFCAPVFVFLAGLSAFLYARRHGLPAASRFLWTRGLWLILLELAVFRLGWDLNYFRPVVNLLVIWVIGISMIFLSALVLLPPRIALATGLAIVFGHNLLQGVSVDPQSFFYPIWVLAYKGGMFQIAGLRFTVLFAFLPYWGLIALGYGLGRVYELSPGRRRKWLLTTGAGAILLFVLLRSGNFYGDPALWSPQKDGLFTFLSFINTTKYPTSLLYILMTLGPAFILLALTEQVKVRAVDWLVTFGRVPMFYYLLHLFLIHFGALAAAFVFTGSFAVQQFSLTGVYLAWMTVNLILFFPCARYARHKAEHPEKEWLSYI